MSQDLRDLQEDLGLETPVALLWERLATRDLIPPDWASDGVCRFVHATQDACACGTGADWKALPGERLCQHCGGGDRARESLPPTAQAAFALAVLGPSRLLTAEALAQEATLALGHPNADVLWYGQDGGTLARSQMRRAGRAVRAQFAPSSHHADALPVATVHLALLEGLALGLNPPTRDLFDRLPPRLEVAVRGLCAMTLWPLETTPYAFVLGYAFEPLSGSVLEMKLRLEGQT